MGCIEDEVLSLQHIRRQRPLFVLSVVTGVYGAVTTLVLAKTSHWHAVHALTTVIHICIISFLYYDLNRYILRLDCALGLVLAGYRAALSERDKLDRARVAFMAFVTHELRNPLHAIQALVNLLKDSAMATDVEVQRDLGTVADAVDTMRCLCDDLLDVASLNSGQFRIDFAPFQPINDFEKSVSLHRPLALAKRIHLTVATPSARVRGLCAYGDAKRFRQVVSNIVSNSVKYTEPGGRVDCKFELCELPDLKAGADFDITVQVTITDTGIGMSQATVARLFEPFVRAADSPQRQSGTGLGLIICRRLAELMNGRLLIHSVEGVGSDIRLQLPLRSCKQLTESKALSLACKAPPLGTNILVVDDDSVNRRIIARMLSGLAIKFEVVANGQDAVAAVSKNPASYSAVFMDCVMPVLDGFEATKQLRRMGFGRPILAMTASADAEVRAKCFECGMNAVMVKPFSEGDIRKLLELLH